MKILITGCNGFVAGHIIKQLNDEYEFIGIGRSEQSAIPGISYLNADICEREKLFSSVQKQYDHVDIVIHAAAQISNDIKSLYQVNCFGTQNVLDLARKLNCKLFIYISSIPVIGYPKQIPITETHSVNPETVYHYTKYFGEIIVEQLKKENVRYVIFRIPSPVGYGMPPSKIFANFVRRSMSHQELEIYGDGQRIQNYLDVRDLASAIRRIIQSDCHGTYHIVGTSISDYGLALRCAAHYHMPGKIKINNNHLYNKIEKWIISGDKAKSDFDYEPTQSIDDSIEYVAEGFQNENHSFF